MTPQDLAWNEDTDSAELQLSEEETLRIYRSSNGTFLMYHFDAEFEIIRRAGGMPWEAIVDYINMVRGES
jgi:hypothetical protein